MVYMQINKKKLTMQGIRSNYYQRFNPTQQK